LAGFHGRLSRKAMGATMVETMRLTTMVLFLLVGATAFTLVFRGLDGDLHVRSALLDLPGGRVGLLLATNLAVFVLGFFIDFFEIAFILLPLLVPAAHALGIQGDEMVWFGVMIAMNLQTSFLTPPFGFSLFYLRGVAPKDLPTTTIYRGVIPFIVLQLIALGAVIAFPGLVTALL
jgi:TRAP-type mannitol/chloroaromatic compound transport system permease large subunit